MTLPVVLVDVGVFQSYILDNIKNLILFGNTNIHVITETQFYDHFKELNVILVDQAQFQDKYTQHSKLDKDFRGGFWQHCSRRFFLINDWMQKNNIENCVHVENDVLSYINFDQVFGKMDYSKMWAPLICNWHCVPSIMFLNKNVFSDFLTHYNFNRNDMENLATEFYRNSSNLESLPIYYHHLQGQPQIYTKNFTGIIFDGNAIGQYLGGVDPRNISGDTRGFINESCVVKTYKDHQFYWVKSNGLYAPYLCKGNILIKIANLHIHSKNVHDFMSDNPLEDKLIKRLN